MALISTVQDVSHRERQYSAWVFVALWLLVFVLYLPAAKAGRVADFPGLYADWKQYSFVDYLNRRWSYLAGMYQLTQLVTWCWFYLFGPAAWPWHLLQVSLHAAGAFLLGKLLFRLLNDNGRQDIALRAALVASVLFAINPYAAESVIWEPAYHYPQALVLQLTVLLFARKFILRGKRKDAFIAGVVFLLSTFTLEFFYLTPVYCLLLGLSYQQQKTNIRRMLSLFLVQLLCICCYFVLMRVTYGQLFPRGGAGDYLSRPAAMLTGPAKNTLNLTLFVRQWTFEWRKAVYGFFDQPAGIALSWMLMVGPGCVLLAALLRSKTTSTRLVSLFGLSAIIALCATGPLQFNQVSEYSGERYLYCALAMWSVVLSLLIFIILKKRGRPIIAASLILLNGWLALGTISDWHIAGELVDRLEASLPPSNGQTAILLNVPQTYKGIPVFGGGNESLFSSIRQEFYPRLAKVNDSLIEMMGYVVGDANDGVDVKFDNDSVLRVTMHDWGRWWAKGTLGATDFDSKDFQVKESATCHHYLLTFRKPPGQYRLFYQQAYEWHELKASPQIIPR